MRLCDLRNLRMDLLRPFEEPDLRIIMPPPMVGLFSQNSSETEEEMSASERRKYKAYTVMQRSGFQHTEYRWRTMLIMWLVCCIISAVGNLLAVITTGIWLDHLSKMKDRTGLVNGLSGFMLLSSVAVGVCFILTAVMICHYWNSNSPKYQPVGKIAKRSRSVRRRLSRMKSAEKKEARPSTKGYHIV
uniref:Uncharacterized protein n=1 Tax=Heterorhabditis bacteriophora TaxID=37862 RepID=A0A1I7WMW7_HETBA